MFLLLVEMVDNYYFKIALALLSMTATSSKRQLKVRPIHTRFSHQFFNEIKKLKELN